VSITVDVLVLSGAEACGLWNTARIIAPTGSPQNSDSRDDHATAYVEFELVGVGVDLQCASRRTEPIVPEPPGPAPCPQGWSRTPVPGKCCPANTNWDGKQCRRGAPPPEERCPPNSDSAYKYPDCRCKQGYVGTPPNCKPRTIEPPRPQCPPNSVGEYPNCRCPHPADQLKPILSCGSGLVFQ
jgi:hypothetical protein